MDTTIVVLGCAYSALVQAAVAPGVGTILEGIMLGVLICGLAGAVAMIVRDVQATRQALELLDAASVLTTADKIIDGKLDEKLRDGTVRLIRTGWLLSAASDAALGRDEASGLPVMARRQELPSEAFLAASEASECLRRGDRSVIALSYCWLTAAHPDPHGYTLAAVRRHLRESGAAESKGLFIDYMSLPQKDANGERSADDVEKFNGGLGVMGYCYASIAATAVVQCKRLPVHEGGVASTSSAYNLTPYDRRGWTQFEEGAAMLVAAHLRQLKPSESPERLQRAMETEKLVTVTAAEVAVADMTPPQASEDKVLGGATPQRVLRETSRAIGDTERTKFTGKGDREAVQGMLAELEWVMKTAFDQMLEVASEGEAEPDPSLRTRAKGGRGGRMGRPTWHNSSGLLAGQTQQGLSDGQGQHDAAVELQAPPSAV